jgi:HK97 family phage portal protein
MALKDRINLALKALSGKFTANEHTRSLYSTLGMGSPVYIDDNKESYVKNAYQANALVYSVVSFIASKAADVPLYVYEWGKEGKGERIYGHPLESFLYRPNPITGKGVFFNELYGFKLITGNTYLYFPRLEAGPNKGRFTEAWIMPSQYTEIISGGSMMPVRGYRLTIGDWAHEYKVDDVLHDKAPNYNYGWGAELYGQAPLQAAVKLVSKSNDSYNSQMKAYQNQGAVGIVSSDEQSQGGQFTEEQARALDANWKKNYGGSNNAGKLAFTSARIKYTQLGLSPVDLGIIEDHKMTLRDICNIYHVPSEIFNDPDNKSYANKQEARKAVYTDAIMPLVNTFLEEFNRFIGDAYGKGIYVDADWSAVPELQADRKSLMEIYSKGVEIGAYTRNEYRQKMGDDREDTITELDTFTTTLNVQPLEGINDIPTPEGTAANLDDSANDYK